MFPQILSLSIYLYIIWGVGGGEVKGRVGKGEVSICTKEVEESSIIFLRDGEGLSAEGVNERRESPFFPSASQTLDGL